MYFLLQYCIASKKHKLKKVLMISSDKAVRPTNIMGATKRLSELIVQAFAKEAEINSLNKNNHKTCFSMVRFGNVLSSSGSAVPLYKTNHLRRSSYSYSPKNNKILHDH